MEALAMKIEYLTFGLFGFFCLIQLIIFIIATFWEVSALVSCREQDVKLNITLMLVW